MEKQEVFGEGGNLGCHGDLGFKVCGNVRCLLKF